MTSPIKALQQALLEGVPLSPAELREMLIRHILVEPNDPTCAPVTACLIDAWANVAAKAGVLDTVDKVGAAQIFEGKLPKSIPDDHSLYPREVLVQVAAMLRVTE